MHHYDSIDDMWRGTLNSLLTFGQEEPSRDGPTREIQGYAACLTNVDYNLLWNEVRQLDPRYAAGETMWYLSGRGDIDLISQFAPSYVKFGRNGVAPGAYGPRIMPFFPDIARQLREKPETRQAVIPLWGIGDVKEAVAGSSPDIPCTVSLTFMVRNRRLNLHVFMRSNDIWLGMPYDVFAFTTIQRIMADLIDVEPGQYYHYVASMHLYQRNHDKAIDAVHEETLTIPHNWARPQQPRLRLVEQFGERLNCADAMMSPTDRLFADRWPMLGDLLSCVRKSPDTLTSPAFAFAWSRRYK